MPAPAFQQLPRPLLDQPSTALSPAGDLPGPLPHHLAPPAPDGAPLPNTTSSCWKNLRSHSQADCEGHQWILEKPRTQQEEKDNHYCQNKFSWSYDASDTGIWVQFAAQPWAAWLRQKSQHINCMIQTQPLGQDFQSPFAWGLFFFNVIFEVSYLISILFCKTMHLSPAFKI